VRRSTWSWLLSTVGIIAASYQHKMPFQKYYSNDFNQYLFVVTSGNLVNVKAWKKVGGFDERIFIDEVDNDFCIRLAINKYHTIGSTDILLKHYLGEPFSVRIPLKKKRIPIGIHNALRVRYTVRNRLFVSRKYLFRYPEFSLNRTYHNLLLLTFILFFYPQKIKYLHAYGKGITDFLFSRYGKIEQ
jgi:rhamnosyltransferase